MVARSADRAGTARQGIREAEVGDLPGRSLVIKPHTPSGDIAYQVHVIFSRMRYILSMEYPTTRPGMSVMGTAMMSHQEKSTLAGADSQNRFHPVSEGYILNRNMIGSPPLSRGGLS